MRENGNGWKGFALAAVTGVLLGGGVSSFISSARTDAVRVELKAEIESVEEDEQKTFEIVIAISERLVRIETMLTEMQRRQERERE